jgi:UDP-glucuronate decarboxylase
VIDLTGSRSKIVNLALPVDDPRQRRPDITVATRDLDWQPKVPLAEGLKETIRYFDRLLTLECQDLAETA